MKSREIKQAAQSAAKASEAQRTRKPRARNAPPRANGHAAVPAATKNSDVVYRDLRNAIVSMKLVPGTPVVEKEITERYGISRTPVREAVLRLAEERLIDVVPKSGTFVARIPLSVLREAIVARRALEEVTVRAATEKASESQIMEMRAIIQRQRETAEAGSEAAFHQADDDFHAAIAAAGRLPGIWGMIQNIRIQVERYRRLTLPQPGRMATVVGEHGDVLDAIAARDADEAVRRMNSHLDKLKLDIAVFRDLWPDYFVHDGAFDADMLAD
ncbi:MAG: GntR family transcriptional regulator [Rhizobiaceae bacterium]|nr:GntR family transcriptional regulator [Rhizobiaceae bacterium]